MAGDEPELRLIGPMAVTRGGAELPLPASRKTRALLAYLAIAGRPVRRDHLCELLWQVPDDPRGSLRWSLSKLRALVGRDALGADADAVELRLPDAAVDWRRLRDVAARVTATSTDELARVAGRGELLAGLELPRCDRFQAWLVAQREDVRQWQAAVLAELSLRDIGSDAALGFARGWVEVDPDAPAAWARLVELLERAGRGPEAAEQRRLGQQRLASVDRPIPAALRRSTPPAPNAGIDVRFCRSADGTNIAYAVTGDGPPIVKIANWMTHLELDAQGPIWRHWIAELSRGRRLVRYDQRGNGLSDWQTCFGLDGDLADLEAVVAAAGVERFDLLALSAGASVAIAYAVRHPERVRRLVLLGGFPAGWKVRGNAEERARREAMITLSREGWDRDNPAFRQMFTSLFLPDSSLEEQHWFNDVQRTTTSADNAAAIQCANGDIDVTAMLPQVSVPTLVAHCRDDAMVPFEAGRAMARAIPGARFLTLEGRNHVLLEGEPAWARFTAAMRAFLSD